jgi:hypothetical protein
VALCFFGGLTGTCLFRFARKVLQRHDQPSVFGAEAFEAVVAVEGRGSFVLGVDCQGKDSAKLPGVWEMTSYLICDKGGYFSWTAFKDQRPKPAGAEMVVTTTCERVE